MDFSEIAEGKTLDIASFNHSGIFPRDCRDVPLLVMTNFSICTCVFGLYQAAVLSGVFNAFR